MSILGLVEKDEVYEIFKKMEKQIEKIIRTIIRFDRAYEEEDYRQEAIFACYEACVKYDEVRYAYDFRMPCSTLSADIHRYERLIKKTNMKKETFAFWYIQKALYRMADTGEVLWKVFDSEGTYLKTLTNKEFRQQRKKLESQGCTFSSFSAIVDLKIGDNEIKDVDEFEDTRAIQWGAYDVR